MNKTNLFVFIAKVHSTFTTTGVKTTTTETRTSSFLSLIITGKQPSATVLSTNRKPKMTPRCGAVILGCVLSVTRSVYAYIIYNIHSRSYALITTGQRRTLLLVGGVAVGQVAILAGAQTQSLGVLGTVHGQQLMTLHLYPTIDDADIEAEPFALLIAAHSLAIGHHLATMQTHADDAHTVAVGHIDLKGIIVLGSHLHIETDIGLGP